MGFLLVNHRSHRDVIGAKGFKGTLSMRGGGEGLASRLEEPSEDVGPDKKNQLITLRRLGNNLD